MNCEIVNKEAFSIVGKGILVSTVNDEDRCKMKFILKVIQLRKIMFAKFGFQLLKSKK